MKWQDYFDDRILNRGYDYYEEGNVESVSQKDHYIKATVNGTRLYHVDIDLDDYTQMSCTCPYFESGNNCKHIAAVLHAIDEDIEYDDDDYLTLADDYHDNGQHLSIDDLIDLTDIDKLKGCLKDIVKKQPNLALQLRLYLLDDLSSYEFNALKSQIESIFELYKDYEGYIEYDDEDDFNEDMTKFINHNLEPLIEKECYKDIFKLCMIINHQLSYLEIDDSISQQCCDIIEEVLSHDINVSLQIDLLKMLLVEVRDSFYSADLETIIFKYFKDKQCLLLKAFYLDKKINSIEINNINDYRLERWVTYRLAVYYQLETSQSSIQDFIKKYWNMASLRQYLIQKKIDEHHYKEAIYYLKESQKLDFEYTSQVIEYSEQLLQIYQELNQQQDYIDELWKLLTYYDSHNINHYKALKRLYNDYEWDNKRGVVIEHYKHDYEFIEEIYLEEKMYDLLMKALENHSGIPSLYKYEDILRPKYEQQLLNKYKTELNIIASVPGSRKRYKELVHILLRLRKYISGDKFIIDIVSEWQILYKSRPAMMEELKQIKI